MINDKYAIKLYKDLLMKLYDKLLTSSTYSSNALMYNVLKYYC